MNRLVVPTMASLSERFEDRVAVVDRKVGRAPGPSAHYQQAPDYPTLGGLLGTVSGSLLRSQCRFVLLARVFTTKTPSNVL